MAKTKAAPAPAVVELELPEAQQTALDSPTIGGFLNGLGPFFQRAGQLEQASRDALDASRIVPPPTTPDEDERIQVLIKSNTAGRKAVEEHWNVTTLFSAFHRRLTAARGRATGNYEGANERLQRLHNDFAEKARRAAAQEQERLRREAEARAQAERDSELQRLEDAAVASEAASADLSEREALFVDYVTGPYTDPNRAASQAGFKDGFKAAARLMSLPKIQDAITAKQEAKRIRDQAAAVRTAPLEVRTETARPALNRAAGASDRVYHSAELLDAKAFIAAHRRDPSVPDEAFLVNTSWLNEQAKSIFQQIERLVGVRYKKHTKTV